DLKTGWRVGRAQSSKSPHRSHPIWIPAFAGTSGIERVWRSVRRDSPALTSDGGCEPESLFKCDQDRIAGVIVCDQTWVIHLVLIGECHAAEDVGRRHRPVLDCRPPKRRSQSVRNPIDIGRIELQRVVAALELK